MASPAIASGLTRKFSNAFFESTTAAATGERGMNREITPTAPETKFGEIGRRETLLIWHLLNDPALIVKAVAALSPVDFMHNERDWRSKPPEKVAGLHAACPVHTAGRLREIVFDAIARRGANTLDAVIECLSSRNNSIGHPLRVEAVDRFRTVMAQLSDGEPICDSFDSLFESIVSDKRKRQSHELAFKIATLDVAENVPLSLLSKKRLSNDFYIEGIFAKGQPGCGFGPPKAGKTSLLGVETAYCLANGVKFLGRFDVPFCRQVLFLSGESSIATLTDSFRRCCKSRGGNPDTDFEGITLSTWLPRFGDARDLKDLSKRISDAEADVVIVDPAGPCMSAGAASTLAIAYAELRAFTDACLNAGATPLLLHHSVKGGNVSALGLKAAAGAGFGEWARQWITLDRIGRFDPVTGQHKLRMSAGGSAGHAGEWIVNWREGNITDADGRCWDVNVKPVTAAKPASADAQVVADAKAVVAAMKEIGKVETARTIRGRAKINGVRADAAFAYLCEAETIAPRELVKARQNCKGYELIGDEAKGAA